jgi:undecaprenyl-diphosphatase
LVCLVGLASLPAAVAGLFLADAIEAFFYGFGATGRIGLMFFITGAAFWFAERRVQKMRAMDTLTWRDAGIIGGCQALALLPGISRSGSTMVAALFLGLNRADAARFSFLLAVPVTLGAALLKLPQMFELGQVGFSPALTGFLTALISALLSIHYLLRLLKTHTFMVFAWYLLIIGAVSMASAWIVL